MGNGLNVEKEAVVEKHIIDCDAKPFIPRKWLKIKEHRKGGQLEWRPERVKTYVFPAQRVTGGFWVDDLVGMEGYKIWKRIKRRDFPVLNANVLDYLLAHPHLIPGEWKGYGIDFWGTIYRWRFGILFVRSLYYGADGWTGGLDHLGCCWNDDSMAALLAA